MDEFDEFMADTRRKLQEKDMGQSTVSLAARHRCRLLAKYRDTIDYWRGRPSEGDQRTKILATSRHDMKTPWRIRLRHHESRVPVKKAR